MAIDTAKVLAWGTLAVCVNPSESSGFQKRGI